MKLYRFFCLSLLPLVLQTASFAQAEATSGTSFLLPPQFVGPADAEHHAAARKFQGIPSVTRAPGGRLWAVWYGGSGTGEDKMNYVILATSGDDGKTWSNETLVIDPDKDGPVRAFDPELWTDPNGHVWIFWAQAIGHEGSVAGVWAMTTKNPDAAEPEWSKPRRLTNGIMMCKPLVLSTGDWALPVSTWKRTDDSAKMVVSSDQGVTWSIRGAVNVPTELRDYDEHMIVERKDGTLWMLVRLSGEKDAGKMQETRQYCIGESVSKDGGKTWSELTGRGRIPHVCSRFFIQRLVSGNLLMVKHADATDKRNNLTAYLSEDDGKTWSSGFLLEEEVCSYPDGVQGQDGRIYVIYDRRRDTEGFIGMAIFTEQDVAAGRLVGDKSKLKIPIARLH